jgi:hypothetical protein
MELQTLQIFGSHNHPLTTTSIGPENANNRLTFGWNIYSTEVPGILPRPRFKDSV